MAEHKSDSTQLGTWTHIYFPFFLSVWTPVTIRSKIFRLLTFCILTRRLRCTEIYFACCFVWM